MLLQLHKASPQTPDAHLDIDEAPEQSDLGAPLNCEAEARQIYACLIRVLPVGTLNCLARLFVLSDQGSRLPASRLGVGLPAGLRQGL